MHIDTFLAKGSTHPICQDYISANEKVIALSDGCSSSPNTDIGARLLILNALQEPPEMFNNNAIINKAEIIRQALEVNQTCLDATLVTMQIKEDHARINIFGDGNLILVKEDGSWDWVNINFLSGAPYYLSYLLDDTRKACYLEAFPENFVITSITSKGEVNSIESKIVIPSLFAIIKWEDVKYIIITSDGLTSFINKKTREPVDTTKVITDILDFRVDTGEFLKRRMNRLLKDYEREDIILMDDLSAGILKI